MTNNTGAVIDILIIGGGLAGLTCALHLRKEGFEVTLIEKNDYPQHKVCGEYISNEVLPYLQWLDADLLSLNPALITRLAVSSIKGQITDCLLPLGGIGVSRYALDHFLYKKALERGCHIRKDQVRDIGFNDDRFQVNTLLNETFIAKIVIGAFGKRSALDQKLSRNFMQQKSPWLAVKGHYLGNIPTDLVQLHNFSGGYCGVSAVEQQRINICYLADYKSFKACHNLEDFQKKVLYQNPQLQQLLEESRPLFEQPLTISQVSFHKKEMVYNHILMIGDTAGLIHPLCGNGMAMAIHSAKIAAELSMAYLKNKISSRAQLEQQYVNNWNSNFKQRLRMGRLLSGLMRQENLFAGLQALLPRFPKWLPYIVKMTHGNPIK